MANLTVQLPEGPPQKKRRFFAEESDEEVVHAAQERSSSVEAPPPRSHPHAYSPPGFENWSLDIDLFAAVVGKDHNLNDTDLTRLGRECNGDLQVAINIFLDGSFKRSPETSRNAEIDSQSKAHTQEVGHDAPMGHFSAQSSSSQNQHTIPTPRVDMQAFPETRYIGSFGAACWATRSGRNLLAYGDHVRISRQKPQASSAISRKRGPPGGLNKRQDTVVRVLSSRGDEIARLETETSRWIAPLLDSGVATIDGTCVFAPDVVRSNDTMYLQLKAYILRSAFDTSRLKPLESNRQTGVFEIKETQEERNLHLRQLALVKLFDEIKLEPSQGSAAIQQHKRQGLLSAAEAAEHYPEDAATAQVKSKASASSTGTSSPSNGGSSPPTEIEEGQELAQDQLDTLYEKAQSFDFNTPEAEPAESFSMDLRKYQKQALHWMIGRETAADTGREQSMHPLWEKYEWPSRDADDKELPLIENCPSFYVNPYSGELSLDMPVQEHNCLGGILADEMGLGKTIEMLALVHSNRPEFVRESRDPTQPVDSLARLTDTETSAISPAPRTTLVIAPMSLLAQWHSEATRASKPDSLKAMLYYGNDRAFDLRSLCAAENPGAPDVLITSYGTILSEYTNASSGSLNTLFALDFFRIILDEAHTIKNRMAKTSRACFELQARHRWALTGTPIVNRLEDLFSLVHFLKVEPWSNFSFWKTFITLPFESGDYTKALQVVQTVLEPIVLRRTKDMKTPDGEPLVPLPSRNIDVENVELSEAERAVYNFIFARAQRTVSANVEAGTLMKSYTTIFAQILRLRQSCCHPILTRNKALLKEEGELNDAAEDSLASDMDLAALIAEFDGQASTTDDRVKKFGAHALRQIQQDTNAECPICSEEPMIRMSVSANCWHAACFDCMIDYIKREKAKGIETKCFNCREPLDLGDVYEVVRDGVDVSLRRANDEPKSAKIRALMTHLRKIRSEDPTTKVVVFSQFTSFLDLIEPFLNRDKIAFMRLDGSMSQKQRAEVIEAFGGRMAENTKEWVLLLSLKAGGVGLNLTAASRVFLMDPWWSWAVEAQAVDRVHRVGQLKPVKVVRFIVSSSIEQKMIKIQDRKKFILGLMSEEEKRRQRIEDIRELLS